MRAPAEATPTPAEKGKPAAKSKYIPWAELLRKTFGFEIVCQKCQSPAMHLPAEVPQLHAARPPPRETGGGGDDWPN